MHNVAGIAVALARRSDVHPVDHLFLSSKPEDVNREVEENHVDVRSKVRGQPCKAVELWRILSRSENIRQTFE